MIELGISNSSPFIALGRIDRLDLLAHQFSVLAVPSGVAKEVGNLPEWVEIRQIVDRKFLGTFPIRIHPGEAEVLLLGMQNPDATLVLDDWYARRFAQERGFQVVGTIGLLVRAKRQGRVSQVRPVIDQLMIAGFRLSPFARQHALQAAGESETP